eukprot:748141-Hanusia_phi.AAC.1
MRHNTKEHASRRKNAKTHANVGSEPNKSQADLHLRALFVFALVVLFWGCIFDLLETNVTLQFVSIWTELVCGETACDYQPSVARMLTGIVFVALASRMLLALGSPAFFNALGSDSSGAPCSPSPRWRCMSTDSFLGINLVVRIFHRRVYVSRLLFFAFNGFLCVLVWKGFEHMWDGLRDTLTVLFGVSRQWVIVVLFLSSTGVLVMLGEMSNQFSTTDSQRGESVVVKDAKHQ